jgi:HlyD family secretion protein
MTATVTVTTAEQKDAVLVPNAALSYARTQGLNQAVMVLQDGKAVPVKVTTGLSDGTNTAVTAGVQEGQVVVFGQSGGTTGTTSSGSSIRTQSNQSSNPLTGGGPPPGVKGG